MARHFPIGYFSIHMSVKLTNPLSFSLSFSTHSLSLYISASEKHITALAMEPGDVLLVDNYRTLHGRDVFQGDRFHAVTWFTWDTNDTWRGTERRIVDKNVFNQAINKMMDWLPKDFVSDQS